MQSYTWMAPVTGDLAVSHQNQALLHKKCAQSQLQVNQGLIGRQSYVYIFSSDLLVGRNLLISHSAVGRKLLANQS